MPLKKQPLNDNEIPIYDEALIYQRGEYWQMRMWLTKERKYARFSLRTRNRDTAIDKAKKHYHELMAQQLSGKTYFSMTTKQAVEELAFPQFSRHLIMSKLNWRESHEENEIYV